MKILTLVHCYLPGYRWGGQLRTVANMVAYLGNEFSFNIITSDRDAGDKNAYAEIEVDNWNDVGPARVFYASPGYLTPVKLWRLLRQTEFDVVYLNSLFDYRFTVLPLLLIKLFRATHKPVIIAPRGELGTDALSIKAARKRLYVIFLRTVGLNRRVMWQASSHYEANDIRRVLGVRKAAITVAPNLPELSPVKEGFNIRPLELRAEPKKAALAVVFLSRISPIKNLEFAFQVLSRVQNRISFDIYGDAVNSEYLNQCRRMATNLPARVECRFCGPLEHRLVSPTLSNYDLFFLPTKGENYGHAIFEALSAGLPVLISDQTPWKDLENAGVGWTKPLSDVRPFVAVLDQLSEETIESRVERRKRVVGYAERVSKDQDCLQANRDLFLQMLLTK